VIAIGLQREQHGERRQMGMVVAVMAAAMAVVMIVMIMVIVSMMMVVAMAPAVMSAAVILRLAFVQRECLAYTDVVFAHM
jgi:hypothetical protein